MLKAKGIDVVFRHTADGRIYGATFIDHRTQSVFNGSRLGTNLSANALQEHFTLPYENEHPIPLAIPKEDGTISEQELHGSGLFDEYGSGLGLMAGGGSSNEAREAAFDRELRRKKKKQKREKPLTVLSRLAFLNNGESQLYVKSKYNFKIEKQWHKKMI